MGVFDRYVCNGRFSEKVDESPIDFGRFANSGSAVARTVSKLQAFKGKRPRPTILPV